MGALLLGLAACSAEGDPPSDDTAGDDAGDDAGDGTGGPVDGPTPEAEVQIHSWWQNASEAAALDALSSTFSADYPSVNIRTITFNGQSEAAMADLTERWIAGDVVDVFQVLPRDLDPFREFDADGGEPRNVLRNLDDLMTSSGAADQIPESILALVQRDGSTWSVPIGLHRHNNLFQNKSLLADLGADAPATLEEFASLCAAVEARNAGLPEDEHIYTMANTLQGWALNILFESILAGGADQVAPGSGADYMHRFFNGMQSVDDPEFQTAAHSLNTILRCSNQPPAVTGLACIGGDRAGEYCSSDAECSGGGSCPTMVCMDAGQPGDACASDADCGAGSCEYNYHNEWDFGWNHAADLVRNERAILFIHGDWAKGEFDAAGFVDYDVLPAFGSHGMFLYNMDTLATFADAANPVNAENYIRTVMSPEGQAEFNIRKGSTPPRRDAPTDGFNEVAQKILEDYRSAEYIQDAETISAWSVGIENPLRDFWRARARDGFADSGPQYDADVEAFVTASREVYQALRVAKGTDQP